jgi:small-conductance mechanosensitive channel
MTLGTEVIADLTLWDLIVIAGTIIIAVVIAQLISTNLKRAMANKVQKKDLEIIIKVLYWAVVVAAAFIVFSQLEIDLSGLLIAGGVIGIVIGIASQSVVGNLISGIFLLAERPISVGDEVLIGNLEGYVEDMRILSTLVRTHDGVYTRVPNQEVFTSNITNYVANPARRVEYRLGLGSSEDPGKVREILLSVLDGSPYSLVRPKPEVNVSAVADDRLGISVYFWTPSRLYTPARSAVLEEIRGALAREGIAIPAPVRHIAITRTGSPGEGPL